MKDMSKQFTEARSILDQSKNILFTTHERTDGDDMGSILALVHHLCNKDRDCQAVIRGGVPPQLRFMPGSDLILEELPKNQNFDLLVVSGCSQKERIGNPGLINLNIPILNIDHHPDNAMFGDVNMVDGEKSSVAELVYDFFKFNAWAITPEIATCLLTGIFTDTGSFMHSNTKDTTLRASADLMARGGRINTIAKNTYKGKSLAGLKAWGKALGNSYFDPKRQIIYSVITDDDLSELGNIPASAFEGLVETLNKVPQAKFAMFLKQDGNIIKGSLRSEQHKGINVSEIAHIFGGGGHKWASGFSIAGKLTKNNQGKWQVVT